LSIYIFNLKKARVEAGIDGLIIPWKIELIPRAIFAPAIDRRGDCIVKAELRERVSIATHSGDFASLWSTRISWAANRARHVNRHGPAVAQGLSIQTFP
jgi:hypothetical protein